MAKRPTKRSRPPRESVSALFDRLEQRITQHDDMLAITFRRIADLQAEVDRLKPGPR